MTTTTLTNQKQEEFQTQRTNTFKIKLQPFNPNTSLSEIHLLILPIQKNYNSTAPPAPRDSPTLVVLVNQVLLSQADPNKGMINSTRTSSI